MAIKRKVRRKARRKAPAVRKAGAGPVMVGGAQSAAETEANMMAAGVMAQHNKAVGRSAPMVRRDTGAVTPKTAPGSTPARAPKVAEAAVQNMGSGRALSFSERAQFEPQFGADLSSVRIHEGEAANTATRALDARAFAYGADIALSDGARDSETLAHEMAHVVSVGEPYLMRDLAREPPGREADPVPLTETETQEATDYNNRRFGRVSTEVALDTIGAPSREVFEATHVPEIQDWQADFRLPADGKIGLRTVEPLGQEMIARGERNSVLSFAVDAHNFDMSNVASLEMDRSVPANANAETTPVWGGRSPIGVAPAAFRNPWRVLIHTIRHEIEHANQVAGMAAPGNINDVRPLLEFQAEFLSIVSPGMLLTSIGNIFTRADIAFDFWNQMSVAERRREWGKFERIRDVLQRRFDAASAATQATHQAMMETFATEAAP